MGSGPCSPRAIRRMTAHTLRLFVQHVPPQGSGLVVVDLVERYIPPPRRLLRARHVSGYLTTCDLNDAVQKSMFYRGIFEPDRLPDDPGRAPGRRHLPGRRRERWPLHLSGGGRGRPVRLRPRHRGRPPERPTAPRRPPSQRPDRPGGAARGRRGRCAGGDATAARPRPLPPWDALSGPEPPPAAESSSPSPRWTNSCRISAPTW